jgi:hypothetical protein
MGCGKLAIVRFRGFEAPEVRKSTFSAVSEAVPYKHLPLFCGLRSRAAQRFCFSFGSL